MQPTINLRAGETIDLPRVFDLNQAEAHWTSDLTRPALDALIDWSTLFNVVTVDAQVCGFVLVMDAKSAYPNDNLNWFASRYNDFWYVDRIVVDSACAGSGLGRALYEDCFERARNAQQHYVTCEYSTTPMNAGSAAFHARMGFTQAGERVDESSGKRLSMQVRQL